MDLSSTWNVLYNFWYTIVTYEIKKLISGLCIRVLVLHKIAPADSLKRLQLYFLSYPLAKRPPQELNANLHHRIICWLPTFCICPRSRNLFVELLKDGLGDYLRNNVKKNKETTRVAIFNRNIVLFFTILYIIMTKIFNKIYKYSA